MSTNPKPNLAPQTIGRTTEAAISPSTVRWSTLTLSATLLTLFSCATLPAQCGVGRGARIRAADAIESPNSAGGARQRVRARLGRSGACPPCGAEVTTPGAGVPRSDAAARVEVVFVDALQDALAGELFARDFYASAARVDTVPRYANLARAEQHHADAIRAAVLSMGVEPRTSHARTVVPPRDLAEARATSIAIEAGMIATYDALLAACRAPALRGILERIQSANRRHLRVVGG